MKIKKIIKNITNRKTIIDIAILLILTLVISRGWFSPGFPKGHDIESPVIAFQTVFQSLFKFHTFPNYTDYAFMGTPIFNVTSQLFSTLEVPFIGVLGINLGTKIIVILLLWLSGVFMYLFVNKLTGHRYASLSAAVIYTYTPYCLVEFIFEGHIELLLSFAVAPLLFYQLEKTIKDPSSKNTIICGLFLALLILSFSQAFPLLIGPFFVAYIIFHIISLIKNKQQLTIYFKVGLTILVIGLCLSAFWWFPLLFQRGQMTQTVFAKQDALPNSVTFHQAIVMRPPSNNSNLAPNLFDSPLTKIIQGSILILPILGVCFNFKNRRVWFFTIMCGVSILLVMGLLSPINIYGFLFDHVPFFNSIRTPGRWLMLTAFCYAVLGGYAIMALTKIVSGNVKKLALVVLVLTITISNIWTQSGLAFQPLKFTSDQENAYAWLASQAGGDYRIANPPFSTWFYDQTNKNYINPVYWGALIGKETVGGPAPSIETNGAANVLDQLYWGLQTGKMNVSNWLNMLNTKYVMLDKTDPLYSNVILGDSYKKVWISSTIDIYESDIYQPKVFLYTTSNSRVVNISDGNTINLKWAEGTQPAMLSIDKEFHSSNNYSVRSIYWFDEPGQEWLNLSYDLQGITINDNDAINVKFYAESDLPDINLSLDLIEASGARYDYALYNDIGIKKGWNDISFPVNLLLLKYSTDTNQSLDLTQVRTLWIGVGEFKNYNKEHKFALYFDSVSIESFKISPVDYKEIRPGKFSVTADLNEPSYLVLNQAYQSDWKAIDNNSNKQTSRAIFGCLNSFYLNKGQHKLELEYTSIIQREIGNIISIISITLLLVLGIIWKIKPAIFLSWPWIKK